MDQALGQLDNVESYVDDIIVYSNTYEEHVRQVTQVMECLEGAELRLRKDKCYQSVEFLGHWISRERSPLRGYLERLKKFTRPQNVKQLQRLLGTVNYYRCYIENIAHIAEPLYLLTRRRMGWAWNKRCKEAFLRLRSTLARESVVLAFPNWKEPFHLETDAYGSEVGAVLGQLDKITGKVKPLDYFSSALSPIQRAN